MTTETVFGRVFFCGARGSSLGARLFTACKHWPIYSCIAQSFSLQGDPVSLYSTHGKRARTFDRAVAYTRAVRYVRPLYDYPVRLVRL